MAVYVYVSWHLYITLATVVWCAESKSYFHPVHPFLPHLFSVSTDLLTDSESAEPQARRVYVVCGSHSTLILISSDLRLA